ncbi:MAG: hypothetical protein LBG26_02310, partial [Treponema sp.]|nr:hypothetical protein [Treponema sp.]
MLTSKAKKSNKNKENSIQTLFKLWMAEPKPQEEYLTAKAKKSKKEGENKEKSCILSLFCLL